MQIAFTSFLFVVLLYNEIRRSCNVDTVEFLLLLLLFHIICRALYILFILRSGKILLWHIQFCNDHILLWMPQMPLKQNEYQIDLRRDPGLFQRSSHFHCQNTIPNSTQGCMLVFPNTQMVTLKIPVYMEQIRVHLIFWISSKNWRCAMNKNSVMRHVK